MLMHHSEPGYQQDPVYHAVQRIRNPDALAEVLSAEWTNWSGRAPEDLSAKIEFTNYKPFERARVMAKVAVCPGAGKPEVVTNIFLHAFAEIEAARKEEAEGRGRGLLASDGPPLSLISPWKTVLWTLPNAPNLPQLGQLMDPAGFQKAFDNGSGLSAELANGATKLLRYVPLKRAILVWDEVGSERRFFVKLFAEDQARAAAAGYYAMNRVAERGELGFDVPEPVAFSSEHDGLLMKAVPGTTFCDLIAGTHRALYAELGHSLARLHLCSAKPIHQWTPEQELNKLVRHMAGIKRALPELSARLATIIRTLGTVTERLDFVGNAPIHGNLFGEQILCDQHRVGIVDWDDLAWGDPLYDVGRLIAHVIYVAARQAMPVPSVHLHSEAFLRAYEEGSGHVIDRRRLTWHLAVSLLLRGKISSLRKLADNWHDHLTFVVDEVERILAGRGRYVRLPPVNQDLVRIRSLCA